MIGVGNYVRRRRANERDQRAANVNLRRMMRELRDHSNPLEMPEQQFIMNFRMDKNCFMEILQEVVPWTKQAERSTSVPPILKLASFLRFLASGSYQKSVRNEYVALMSQSIVSKNVSDLLDIFERHFCSKWIRFPTTETETAAIKEKFFNKYGIPGVVGCVDGTHIELIGTGDRRNLYYNRKGFYSLNALVICDFDMVVVVLTQEHQGRTTTRMCGGSARLIFQNTVQCWTQKLLASG